MLLWNTLITIFKIREFSPCFGEREREGGGGGGERETTSKSHLDKVQGRIITTWNQARDLCIDFLFYMNKGARSLYGNFPSRNSRKIRSEFFGEKISVLSSACV